MDCEIINCNNCINILKQWAIKAVKNVEILLPELGPRFLVKFTLIKNNQKVIHQQYLSLGVNQVPHFPILNFYDCIDQVELFHDHLIGINLLRQRQIHTEQGLVNINPIIKIYYQIHSG